MPEYRDFPLAEVEKRISNALKAWYLPVGGPEDLLSDFLLFQEKGGDAAETASSSNERYLTNQLLTTAIDHLERQEPELAKVLRLRFIDKEKLWSVANKLSVSEQTVSRLQKKAVEQLSALIHNQENAVRTRQAQELEAALPPASYTRLFGVAEAKKTLLNLLLDPQGPAVLAVVGLGGIGKTALADQVVRRVIHRFHFSRVIWLRIEYQSISGTSSNPGLTFENILTGLAHQLWPDQAEQLSPQQRLVLLRQELESRPHLIVIDNLENESDNDYILNHLHGFARPTKFLLTSRSRLAEQSAVYNFPLQELSFTDAVEFVRYHAQECGILSVAAASESELTDIYDIAGGNPLAIKLIIGLLEVLPLPEILSDFNKTQTDPIQGMYRHIFRKSWNTLSDDGRTLLQSMPLIAESGGQPHYLMTVSGLSGDKLWPALHELHNRSLIEVRGSLQQKRYGIHRLTSSFVCTEIMNLPEWV